MMKSSSKKLMLVGLLVLGAGLLAYGTRGFLPQYDSASRESPQTPDAEHAGDLAHKPVDVGGEAVKPGSVARNVDLSQRSASSIYADSKLDYVDRFHLLMDLARGGDSDARYLTYRMRERCRLAGAMSEDTVLQEIWNEEMGRAIEELKARCGPLVEDPVFQVFSRKVEDIHLGFFTANDVLAIKRAFADSGAKVAVSTAVGAFRRRPDIAIATAVADTLSELGALEYGLGVRIDGPAAVNTAMKKDLFSIALMLHSCDFGAPCGPGSDRMLRICGLGGGCQRGQDLYAYYAYTLSPENMKNVEAILDALRQRQWAHSE